MADTTGESSVNTGHQSDIARITIHIKSPSTGLKDGLTFDHLPFETTVGELKRLVFTTSSVKPTPERQRLLYQGRALINDKETLAQILHSELLRNSSDHATLHLVLRPLDDEPIGSARSQANSSTVSATAATSDATTPSQATSRLPQESTSAGQHPAVPRDTHTHVFYTAFGPVRPGQHQNEVPAQNGNIPGPAAPPAPGAAPAQPNAANHPAAPPFPPHLDNWVRFAHAQAQAQAQAIASGAFQAHHVPPTGPTPPNVQQFQTQHGGGEHHFGHFHSPFPAPPQVQEQNTNRPPNQENQAQQRTAQNFMQSFQDIMANRQQARAAAGQHGIQNSNTPPLPTTQSQPYNPLNSSVYLLSSELGPTAIVMNRNATHYYQPHRSSLFGPMANTGSSIRSTTFPYNPYPSFPQATAPTPTWPSNLHYTPAYVPPPPYPPSTQSASPNTTLPPRPPRRSPRDRVRHRSSTSNPTFPSSSQASSSAAASGQPPDQNQARARVPPPRQINGPGQPYAIVRPRRRARPQPFNLGVHLWLIARLLAGFFLLSSGSSWRRTIVLAFIAVGIYLVQMGFLGPLEGLGARWGLGGPHGNAGDAAGLAGAGRAWIERRLARLELRGPPPATVPAAEGTTPPDGAPNEGGNAAPTDNWSFRDVINRIERVIVLFLASLVPGVGERVLRGGDRGVQGPPANANPNPVANANGVVEPGANPEANPASNNINTEPIPTTQPETASGGSSLRPRTDTASAQAGSSTQANEGESDRKASGPSESGPSTTSTATATASGVDVGGGNGNASGSGSGITNRAGAAAESGGEDIWGDPL